MTKKYIPWDNLAFRKNPYPGKLIAIEGIDGSGKTTQTKELVKMLNKNGCTASYSKEPTEDVIGKFIREKILSGDMKINPLALQYLFNADRAMHMEKIEQLLQKGMTIVMDRYFWSSVAYGMSDMDLPAGRQEKPLEWNYVAFSILSFYHQFLLPDVTFFLTISRQEALKRIQKSEKHGEIYDSENHLPRIEANYEKLMANFPGVFTKINGEREKDEVLQDLFLRTTKFLQK